MPKSIYQYYRITERHKPYKGDRIFRVAVDSDKVLQVCRSFGEVSRKGRATSIGVYYISMQSFATNYLAMNYVENSTKQTFNKAFEDTVSAMR